MTCYSMLNQTANIVIVSIHGPGSHKMCFDNRGCAYCVCTAILQPGFHHGHVATRNDRSGLSTRKQKQECASLRFARHYLDELIDAQRYFKRDTEEVSESERYIIQRILATRSW